MQTQTMKLRELTVRYSVKKTDAGQPVVVGRMMNSPRDSAAALLAVLQDQPTEVFAILCLSTKHRVIAYHEVSRGTLDSTLVLPCDRPAPDAPRRSRRDGAGRPADDQTADA